jgi:TRAP-type C4-dicarboxylate transport system permease small subunit
MTKVLKALRGVCLLFMIISCIAILVLAAMTTYNVVMRGIFSKPLTGATEWGQMLLIIAMLAMGIAVADGRAIRVGMVVDRFSKKPNIVFEFVMGFLALVFFALVGVALVSRIGWLMDKKKAYLYLGWPEWPMYLSLGISFITSALGTIVFVIKSVMKIIDAKGKELTDDPELAAILLAYEDGSGEGSKDGTEDLSGKDVSL